MGEVAVFDSFVGYWDPLPYTELCCPALIEGKVSNYCILICHVWLISLGGLYFLKRKGEEEVWGLAKQKWVAGNERRRGRKNCSYNVKENINNNNKKKTELTKTEYEYVT